MTDKLLIAGFLDENFDLFQAHLDRHDIEPSEAEVIIDRLKEEN